MRTNQFQFSNLSEASNMDANGKIWVQEYSVLLITPENSIEVDWENTDTNGYSFEEVYSKLGLDPNKMKIFSGGFAAINKDIKSGNLMILARYGDSEAGDPIKFNAHPEVYSPETREELLQVAETYRELI